MLNGGPAFHVSGSGLIFTLTRKKAVENQENKRTWPEDRIEALKQCLLESMTASEIGKKLGLSRNSIIGKVHRLGLRFSIRQGAQPGSKSVSPHKRRAPRRKATKPQKLTAITAPVLPTVGKKKPTGNMTIFDLRHNSCRWPLGDIMAPAVHFCGAKTVY